MSFLGAVYAESYCEGGRTLKGQDVLSIEAVFQLPFLGPVRTSTLHVTRASENQFVVALLSPRLLVPQKRTMQRHQALQLPCMHSQKDKSGPAPQVVGREEPGAQSSSQPCSSLKALEMEEGRAQPSLLECSLDSADSANVLVPGVEAVSIQVLATSAGFDLFGLVVNFEEDGHDENLCDLESVLAPTSRSPVKDWLQACCRNAPKEAGARSSQRDRSLFCRDTAFQLPYLGHISASKLKIVETRDLGPANFMVALLSPSLPTSKARKRNRNRRHSPQPRSAAMPKAASRRPSADKPGRNAPEGNARYAALQYVVDL
eukprot:TRINITY_DN9638_c1_g1_i1.p1 TRINITY_DN9638_c1_g1~~TRINITY_DN9638_c1_g1_i1.p1  ORF type:complete len:317 (-),score=33.47 TRINITY_DN9638_c1_g1_i1:308-1258(-)